MAEISVKASSAPPWGRLAVAAALALIAHLAAGLAMAFLLRYGLDTAVDFPQRISFLVHQKASWVSGWLLWNVAALSFLYFNYTYYRTHADVGEPKRRLLLCAVLICTAAVVADLSAEMIQMFVLTDYANQILVSSAVSRELFTELFFASNRTATILTGFMANGLYTASVALTMLATARQYHPIVITAGIFVLLGGIWLSTTSITNSVAGMVWSNLLLVPSLLVWLAGVAIYSRMRARSLKEQNDNLVGKINGCADKGIVREAEPND